MTTDEKTIRIRALNDALRTTLEGGKLVMTAGVSELGPAHLAALLQYLRTFDRFEEGDDPYGEHDFGAFEYNGQRFFWKIEYYDLALEWHSEDASDPSKTTRVLTLMLAHEY